MKEGYIHIVNLLDRSFSMKKHVNVTLEGFNAFVTRQKALPGQATATLIQFDDQYELNYDMLPLANVPELTEENYQPRGNTAMLDAIGRAIDETGAKLAAMREEDRPSRVLFVIQTDGEENCSRHYIGSQNHTKQLGDSLLWFRGFDKYARVREMVKHQQEKYNWDFLFLGANQDAVLSGGLIGVNAKSSLTYDMGSSVNAFQAASNYTTNFRSAETLAAAKCCSLTDEDRSAAVGTKAQ